MITSKSKIIKIYFYLFYLSGFALFFVSCANQEDLRPKRACRVEELLLSQTDYPSNTIINDSRTSIAEEPLESAGGSANYNNDATSQLVARHFSTKNAIKEYEKTEKRVFAPGEVAGLWKTPVVLDLNNLSADRHKIACGNVVSFGNRCYMVGQYEEYYVFFRADISAQGINDELFRDLVLKIDGEMAACLGR